ncbi:3-hydroxyanthranilate 3,4-dioxygenase [Roseomonas chloroacetimidivorans]|jgi:3-hydroxyanthranilate 3,4-dioxygenase|uniref:3-hydroxyanthranilate 3,4-dioxygenase n=1 Tax=Roseomonas chloroacetimidivorans TaxID=1766656 RepID=UPI003C740507
MPVVDLQQRMKELEASGKHVSVLWQHPDSLVFMARGREYRSEFHINPSDEVMFQVKGTMHLHSRTPDGKEEITVLPEGSMIYTPKGTPHSPRFPPDAFAVILEQERRPGDVDRFQWYCPNCDALVHEESAPVAQYSADPVGQAYKRFYGSEKNRTCEACGHITPVPEGFEV